MQLFVFPLKTKLANPILIISFLALLVIQCYLITPASQLPAATRTPISRASKVISPENTNKVVQLEHWSRQLKGNVVVAIALSEDNKYIASSSGDGILRLLDSQNGNIVYRRDASEHGLIVAIEFMREQNEVVLGYQDGTLTKMKFDGTRIWETKVQLGITQVSYSPTGNIIAVVSRSNIDNGLVQFIELTSGTIIASIKGTGIGFLAGGNSFILGTRHGNVELCRLDTLDVGKVIDTSNFGPTTILVSPDGNIVLATSNNRRSSGDIRLIRIADSYYITALWATRHITDIAYSPNSDLIATSTMEDSAIQLWDGKSGYMLSRLTGHTKPITSIKFSSDGRLLVSGSMDGTIRIWGIP